MLAALNVFGRAHSFSTFLAICAGCGILACVTSSVPVPQLELNLRSYTKAVGFYLAPLLAVPAFASALDGLQPYESQSSRSLTAYRLSICVLMSSIFLAVLLPSASLAPVAVPYRILVENGLWILGLTLTGAILIPYRWIFIPVYVVALMGIAGPEGNLAALLLPVDRLPQTVDLCGGILVYLVGTASYSLDWKRGNLRGLAGRGA